MKNELVQEILKDNKEFPAYMQKFLEMYDKISSEYGEFSETHKEFIKEACSNGYLGAMLFCKFFLSRMFFCDFGVIHERTFRKLIHGEELEGVTFPRESGKTSITRGFLTWGLTTKWRNFFLYVGNTDEAIRKNMLWVATEIEENKLIKAVYGDLYSDKKWSEREFELKNGCAIAAMSRGKSARGIIKDTRPEYILIDDFEDDESANSQEQTEKTDNWLFSNLLPAKSKFNGRAFIVGTLITESCVLGRLIQDPSWNIDVCSAWLTDENGLEIRDKNGNEISFCPEIWPYDKLKAKQNQLFNAQPMPKHQTWFTEYMNKPANTIKRGWRMEDVLFWEGYYKEGTIYTESEQHKVTSYTAVDIASTRSGTDYTCITTWGCNVDNVWFELETWRKLHTSTNEIVDTIFEHFFKYNSQEVYIELIACQDLILDAYDARASKEKYSPFLVEIRKRSKSKEDRIKGAIQGRIHARKLRLRKGHCPETYIELEQFPTGTNDDVLDPMADIFSNGTYTEVIKVNEKSLDVDDLPMFNSSDTIEQLCPVRKMVNY